MNSPTASPTFGPGTRHVTEKLFGLYDLRRVCGSRCHRKTYLFSEIVGNTS